MAKKTFQRATHAAGMTLIEIMIVVALIGGMMALGTTVMFPSDDAKLREEAVRLAGTIKFIYNEAAIKNKYYRLAFNLEENSYRVESSTEPFFVSTDEDEKKPSGIDKPVGADGAAEGADGEVVPPPTFTAEEGVMVKPVKLPSGLKIKDVSVLHAPERREVGIVHAYFLPNGWAEPMVINLSDEGEEAFYSLQINPLTGKAKIRTEYREVDEGLFQKDTDSGEVF